MARNERSNGASVAARPGSGRAAIVSREPMHGQILPHIRKDIVVGRWRPGERLSEPALCEEFKVSRTPLRDALRLLESEGLIQLVPHVGAIVTEATGPDIGEKMEVLIAVEQFAAMKVARLGSPSTIQRIARLHRSMVDAAKASDREKYYRLNDDFHRTIVLGSMNATLADTHERVMWHVHRARHIANKHEPLSPDAGAHHQSIVDAIISRDGDAAERCMRDHLLAVTRVLGEELSM